MASGRRYTDSICASVILILVWYVRVQNHALTRSPVVVVVPRMQLSNVSVERSGWAAQLMLMVLKSWCSTGFHLEAPVAKWQTVTAMLQRLANCCKHHLNSRGRCPLLPPQRHRFPASTPCRRMRFRGCVQFAPGAG